MHLFQPSFKLGVPRASGPGKELTGPETFPDPEAQGRPPLEVTMRTADGMQLQRGLFLPFRPTLLSLRQQRSPERGQGGSRWGTIQTCAMPKSAPGANL